MYNNTLFLSSKWWKNKNVGGNVLVLLPPSHCVCLHCRLEHFFCSVWNAKSIITLTQLKETEFVTNIDSTSTEVDIKNFYFYDYLFGNREYKYYNYNIYYIYEYYICVNRFPLGLEDVSKYPVLIQELLRRNWPEQEVADVLRRNFLRVFEQVEKVSDFYIIY